MNKRIKYILIGMLVSLLFLVRGFESSLFYDPLIEYFQNDYLYSKMPEINTWQLVIDIVFRYAINSLLTLGIIHLIFENKRFLKFTGFFLMLAFIILIVVFVFLVRSEFEHGYLFPFYIRRFLIHPLFLLVLLPAFYYQKMNKNKM